MGGEESRPSGVGTRLTLKRKAGRSREEGEKQKRNHSVDSNALLSSFFSRWEKWKKKKRCDDEV